MNRVTSVSRRRFIRSLAAGTIVLGMGRGYATELLRTPRQTAGPFYPESLPLDSDNDLLVVGEGSAEAAGQVTHLRGRVLDTNGRPVRNALVEIWQVDSNGVYLHRGSHGYAERDKRFQGYGRFETGSSGEYYFRTIKPVPYPGRTPHIHFAVTRNGGDPFTTQCYVEGEPGNARDGVLNRIRDARARQSVIVPFAPIPDSPRRELSARFDIILGKTPAS